MAACLGAPAAADPAVAPAAKPALTSAAPAAAKPGPKRYRADYTVSLYGLTLARTSFTSTIDGNQFSVSGTIATAGVARIVDDTKGTTAVHGKLSETGARPDSFRIDYTSGRKHKRTAIDFADGTVSRTVNVPPLKKRKNWVPLGPDDLKAATDPLSGILLRADSPAEVCGRTLRYYDGELRADITLSYAGKAPMTIPGYSGDTVLCDARFTPIAGYRKGNSTIEYLKKRGRIKVAFAPMGSMGMYVPVSASVGTRIGTVTVRADRFAAVE
jgi:hypothetical protein